MEETTPPAAPPLGRILLVEDDPGARELIALQLRAAGYEVEAYGDAHGALEALRHQVFQLALCDIGLPQISGLDFAQGLRAISPETPLVLMSAITFDDRVLDAVAEGAAAFLAKPFEPQDLLWLVRRTIKPIISPAPSSPA